MSIDGSGNLYVRAVNSIYRVSPAGSVTLHYASNHSQYGLASDADGNIYLGDKYTGIRRVTPAGRNDPIIPNDPELQTATAAVYGRFTVDKSGNVYAYLRQGLVKITREGVVTTIAPVLTGAYASQLTVDDEGNLYVRYSGARTIIQRLSPDGVSSIILEYDRDSASTGNHIDINSITALGSGTLAITTDNGVFLLRHP